MQDKRSKAGELVVPWFLWSVHTLLLESEKRIFCTDYTFTELFLHALDTTQLN